MTHFFVDPIELYFNHIERTGLLNRSAKKLIFRLGKVHEAQYSQLEIAWAKYLASRTQEHFRTEKPGFSRPAGPSAFRNQIYFLNPELFQIWLSQNKKMPLAFHEELSILSLRHPKHFWSVAGSVFTWQAGEQAQKPKKLAQVEPATPVAVVEPTQLHAFQMLFQRIERIFESVATAMSLKESRSALHVELSVSCCPITSLSSNVQSEKDHVSAAKETATEHTSVIQEGIALSQANPARATMMSLSWGLPWQRQKTSSDGAFSSKGNHVFFDRTGTMLKSNINSFSEMASFALIAEEVINANLNLENASTSSLIYFWSLDNQNRFMLHHVIPSGNRRNNVTDQIELSNTFFPVTWVDPRQRTLIEKIWQEAWRKPELGALLNVLQPWFQAAKQPALHFESDRNLIKMDRTLRSSAKETAHAAKWLQFDLPKLSLLHATRKLETKLGQSIAKASLWQNTAGINLAVLIEAFPQQPVWKLGVRAEHFANFYEESFVSLGLSYTSQSLSLTPHGLSFKKCSLPFELLCAQLLFAMERCSFSALHSSPLEALSLVDPGFRDHTGRQIRLIKQCAVVIEGLCNVLRSLREFRRYVEQSNGFLARNKSAVGLASKVGAAKQKLQRYKALPRALHRAAAFQFPRAVFALQKEGNALVLANLEALTVQEIAENKVEAYVVANEYLREPKVWQIVTQGTTLICGVELPSELSTGAGHSGKVFTGEQRAAAEFKLFDKALLMSFGQNFKPDNAPNLVTLKNSSMARDHRTASILQP